MGGYGSGQWTRWNTKPSSRRFLRLDISSPVLRRETVSGFRSMTWSRGGEPVGTVDFSLTPVSLTLRYTFGASSGSPEQILSHIRIVRTQCNFGGSRRWFECPRCRRRVRVLYGGKYFLCRHCQRFTYESQLESWGGRAQSRVSQLEERIKYTGLGFYKKPKGMHWRTFDRICDEIEFCDSKAAASFLCDMKGWKVPLGEEIEKDLRRLTDFLPVRLARKLS